MKDLMTPRVIVTAHYPDSPFQVGDVLYKSYAQSWLTNEAHEVYTPDETFLNAVKATEIEKATTCFNPLAWYEKRDIKDMPEYVKFRDELVCKVVKWAKDGIPTIDQEVSVLGYETDVLYPVILRLFTPSTSTEYEAYINSKI